MSLTPSCVDVRFRFDSPTQVTMVFNTTSNADAASLAIQNQNFITLACCCLDRCGCCKECRLLCTVLESTAPLVNHEPGTTTVVFGNISSGSQISCAYKSGCCAPCLSKGKAFFVDVIV